MKYIKSKSLAEKCSSKRSRYLYCAMEACSCSFCIAVLFLALVAFRKCVLLDLLVPSGCKVH